MYGLNNLFVGAKALQDWSGKDTSYAGQAFKPHYFSSLQLASYLFANTMLMVSRRDQITGKGFAPKHIGKLEDAAARIIAAQPTGVQQTVLADVSNYMSRQKGVTLDAPTIATHLAKRVGEIAQEQLSPAVNEVKWTAREEARISAAAAVQK